MNHCFLTSQINGPWSGHLLEAIAHRGQLETLKFMVENGEEVPQHTRQFDLGYAAFFSAQNGHVECVKYLVDLGFSHDDIMNVAVHLPVVKYLHEKGYQWNVNTTTNAARHHQLDTLRYLHENGCPWDESTIIEDTFQCIDKEDQAKAIEVMKYLREQRCSWSTKTCELAVDQDSFEILKFLHENNCPWDKEVSGLALKLLEPKQQPKWLSDEVYGRLSTKSPELPNLEILKYLIDNGCWEDPDNRLLEITAKHGDLKTLQFFFMKGAKWTEIATHRIITRGKLDMLKFAHENGAPWNPSTINVVLEEYNHELFSCIEYAVENGCPWDPETTLTAAQKSNNKDILEFFLKKCKDIGYDASNITTKISPDPDKESSENAGLYKERRNTVKKSTPTDLAKKSTSTEVPKKASETKSNCSIS